MKNHNGIPAIISITILLFLTGVITSCKNGDSTSGSGNEHPQGSVQQLTPQEGGDHAKWTFLTNGLLVNRATVVVGQEPGENPNKGGWYDLKEDGTYSFGKYLDEQHNGYWNYNGETELLEFLPADQEVKKSEFRVLYNNDILVMVGTSKYGDNNKQMQFVRRDERPQPE